MSQNSNDEAIALVAFPVVVFVGFCYWLSRQIGADLGVTIYAVLKNAGVLIVGGYIVYLIRDTVRPLAALFGFLAATWLCWFEVMDNIAAKAKEAAYLQSYQSVNLPWQAYLDSGWVHWLIFLILAGTCLWLSLRE